MMLRSALFVAGAAAFIAPAPRIKPMLRADLEEAPPAPAPLNAPEQSVDEVETNMLSDFTQRMAARGTESNVRDAAQEYVDSVKSNVQVEQSGPSIVYVAGQAALLLLLLVGDVPVVGGAIETLLGPGLVVAGIGAIAKGVIDLGAGNLTPFAAPVEGNELKTTGAFSYVRHPIYGGLLVAAGGLSVATESFQRLLVVFLLYLLLDAKSAYEERELERIHPAYRAYKQVTPKFFPSFDELDEILD
jgi:protein-S-isoprenylcysteine O-methyltransferase Ste14